MGDTQVFNLATNALLFGSPLVVFYVLASEDISGWNRNRPTPNTICRSTIVDWPTFWRGVGEPGDPDQFKGKKVLLQPDAMPSDVLWRWLSDVKLRGEPKASDSLGAVTSPSTDTKSSPSRFSLETPHPVSKTVVLEEMIRERDKDLWFWQRWLQFGGSLVGTDDRFTQRWNDASRLDAWKSDIVNAFNDDLLSDPSLFLAFVEVEKVEVVNTSAKFDMKLHLPWSGTLLDIANPIARYLELPQPILLPEGDLTMNSPPRDEKNWQWKFRSAPQFSGLSGLSGNVQIDDKDSVFKDFDPEKELPRELMEKTNRRAIVIQKLVARCNNLRKRLEPELRQRIPVLNADADANPSIWRTNLKKTKNGEDAMWYWVNCEYEDSVRGEQELIAALRLVAAGDRNRFQGRLSEGRNRRIRFEKLMEQIQGMNWNLLRAYFGAELLYPQSEVFALVVNAQDQALRLRWFGYSVCLFFLLGMCVSVNPTMLHGFYRDQLATLWLLPHPEYGSAIPIHMLKNCELGGPLPLMHGTLNLTGRYRDHELDTIVRFTFSPLHVGAERVGYCESARYMRGQCDLADVMAISGAAVSPVATDSIMVRALLVLFNFRMGQWLRHPTRPPGDLSWPSPLRLVWNQLMTEPALREYQFVSDGGHNENTGIGALLQRRCRVIIACDAGQDGEFEFDGLRKLLAEGSNKYGVRMWMTGSDQQSVQFDDLSPHEQTKLSKRHFLILRIEYPDDRATRLAGLSSSPSGETTAAGPSTTINRTGYLILHQVVADQQRPCGIVEGAG